MTGADLLYNINMHRMGLTNVRDGLVPHVNTAYVYSI